MWHDFVLPMLQRPAWFYDREENRKPALIQQEIKTFPPSVEDVIGIDDF